MYVAVSMLIEVLQSGSGFRILFPRSALSLRLRKVLITRR